MRGHPFDAETAFQLGIRQGVEDQETAKPPWRKATATLVAYIAFFGVFLPGLFMGLGNFIICPFSIPGGWKMSGSEARGRCDQVGAQKAAIIYTAINIFYGMFIGYAANHLIRRSFLSVKEFVAKQKRIREQGKKSEIDRVARENVATRRNKLKTDQERNGKKFEQLSQEEELFYDEEAVINGYQSHSHRTQRGSKTDHRSKRRRNLENEDSCTQMKQDFSPFPRPMNQSIHNIQPPPQTHQRGPPFGQFNGPQGPPCGPHGPQPNHGAQHM